MKKITFASEIASLFKKRGLSQKQNDGKSCGMCHRRVKTALSASKQPCHRRAQQPYDSTPLIIKRCRQLRSEDHPVHSSARRNSASLCSAWRHHRRIGTSRRTAQAGKEKRCRACGYRAPAGAIPARGRLDHPVRRKFRCHT